MKQAAAAIAAIDTEIEALLGDVIALRSARALLVRRNKLHRPTGRRGPPRKKSGAKKKPRALLTGKRATAKSARSKCGKCGKSGHNRRSCKR